MHWKTIQKRMRENDAIEIIKYASAFNNDNSPLTKALDMSIKALENQEKLKERITEYEKLYKKNPREEFFVGEVVRILKEFVVEE